MCCRSVEVEVKVERKRRPRRPKPIDPDFEKLMAFTGLYDVYFRALREELWTAARLYKTGLVRYPCIKYVPPPCAMMFLRTLEEHYDVSTVIDDEKGRASIIYGIPFKNMEAMDGVACFSEKGVMGHRCGRLQEKHGCLHIVGGLRAEYSEGASTGVSKLEFVCTIWKLHPTGDLRPGTSLLTPLGKYLQVATYAKQLVLGWPRPDDLSPAMRAWAALPVVRPVTRAPPKDWEHVTPPVVFPTPPNPVGVKDIKAALVQTKRKQCMAQVHAALKN